MEAALPKIHFQNELTHIATVEHILFQRGLLLLVYMEENLSCKQIQDTASTWECRILLSRHIYLFIYPLSAWHLVIMTKRIEIVIV